MYKRGTYSWLPITSRGWNNGIGWKIPELLIIVGDGIILLGGKFNKYLMIVGGWSSCFSFFKEKC